MPQEVFKPSLLRAIILPVILIVAWFYVYYYIVTLPHYSPPFPVWVYLFLLIPAFLLIEGQSKKLVIEDEMIRYVRVFPIKQIKEVSLHDVRAFTAEFFYDETDKSTTKIIQVIDKEGKSLFNIPISLLRAGTLLKFKTAIHAVNPDIKIG